MLQVVVAGVVVDTATQLDLEHVAGRTDQIQQPGRVMASKVMASRVMASRVLAGKVMASRVMVSRGMVMVSRAMVSRVLASSVTVTLVARIRQSGHKSLPTGNVANRVRDMVHLVDHSTSNLQGLLSANQIFRCGAQLPTQLCTSCWMPGPGLCRRSWRNRQRLRGTC